MDFDSYIERCADPEMPPCANCEHGAHDGPCEYERGDVWIEGRNCEGWVATGPCGCTNYEPMTLESTLQDEGKI